MTAAEALALLRRRGWTLAVAESLTGGLLTDVFVQVPGASAVLVGGVTAYATPVKASLLGVDAGLLAREGAVHPEVARAMAYGVRRALQVDGRAADVGISTTGVAGPDPQDGRPAGTVHVGVAIGDRSHVVSATLPGNRAAVRAAVVVLAVDTLLHALRTAE